MAKKNKHYGLHTHRFKGNREEMRFAREWVLENARGRLLDHLLDARPIHQGSPPASSERDAQVAGTVIQWLGSPVGRHFLEKLGYVKATPKKEKVETPRDVPEPGDRIYVPSAYFLDRGQDDRAGGRAVITRVYKDTSAGKQTIFIEVREHPGIGYNYEVLRLAQDKLRKEYKLRVSRMDPDR